ncbi:hypothetical protein KPH14_009789 [Odynerus spinipes]|uniref:Uncharacterized protein n=1 Tax=Odynerus spinipes TaxID=1348599 RepID=A0AAD9RX42_9HYME|nr:hypothetical protein KPH14_009789 [Odynerus spinipes]
MQRDSAFWIGRMRTERKRTICLTVNFAERNRNGSPVKIFTDTSRHNGLLRSVKTNRRRISRCIGAATLCKHSSEATRTTRREEYTKERFL